MRKIMLIWCVLGLIYQCKNEQDNPFLIQIDQVGKLNRTAMAQEIDSIYKADSVAVDSSDLSFGKIRKYEIYERGGQPLLTLNVSADSLSKIETVQIHDPRFKTVKGISLSSTFKDIREAYEIKKIITTMNNVVIFVKNQDVYFTISREELPASLRYASDVNVEEVQIPDKATIKYMMVGWD